jgi:hypothetical protein
MPAATITSRSLLAAAVAALLLAGCSDDAPERSTEAYCGAVQTNAAALASPALATAADVEATLALYRSIAEVAPLAVQPEWEQLLGVVETAATVVPGDQLSAQTVADAARSAEPAARRIADYTRTTCGVALPIAP